jgi:hypothetical protein
MHAYTRRGPQCKPHRCCRPARPLPRAAAAGEHPAVSIGSYPHTGKDFGGYKVKLQLTSRDGAALAAAVQAVRGALDVFDAPPA